MERETKSQDGNSKRKVERYSPNRLLKDTLVLPGDIAISVEKLNGRLMVRVDQPSRCDLG